MFFTKRLTIYPAIRIVKRASVASRFSYSPPPPSLLEGVFYMDFPPAIEKKFKKATQIAFKLKKTSLTGRAFHLTAIFKKSRIISVGINNYKKTHPKIEKLKYLNKEKVRYNACIHSELSAWLKLNKKDCSGFVFVNVRIDKNDRIGMSYPCCGCKKLLKEIKFKKFYYTSPDGHFMEYR